MNLVQNVWLIRPSGTRVHFLYGLIIINVQCESSFMLTSNPQTCPSRSVIGEKKNFMSELVPNVAFTELNR